MFPTAGIITNINTHYNLSCCFLIPFFANLFSFLLVAFDEPRDIVSLLNFATRSVTPFTVTYTVTFFYFDSLFPLLYRSDDCNFDAPLFQYFLLPLCSIVLGFDTLRLDRHNFKFNSSFSFNGLYLTFGLLDIVLLYNWCRVPLFAAYLSIFLFLPLPMLPFCCVYIY